ncbi:hypothetical protein [Acetobacter malorum]|uniref:hypothetical protein n=1 Tax=Acetobacter malorum TaxID=178901 RepID=UPI001E493699|nr:hypothetical protein [Acetobacter malorum]
MGPYSQCVRATAPVAGYGHRLSWYFDPEWYLETYPEVRKELDAKEWTSALHHYLANKTPTLFNPDP